jgi:hypothetical protein
VDFKFHFEDNAAGVMTLLGGGMKDFHVLKTVFTRGPFPKDEQHFDLVSPPT